MKEYKTFEEFLNDVDNIFICDYCGHADEINTHYGCGNCYCEEAYENYKEKYQSEKK